MTPQADPVLELFRSEGAYLKGHFRLTSGLHSPEYLQCALVLAHPAHAQHLGEALAAALRTVTPALHMKGSAEYMEFLKRALGAVEEMRVPEPSGGVRYGLLRVGGAAIEIGEGEPMPGSFMLYVTDPDVRYERAIAAGATSVMALSDQPYGRVGGVEDSAGNQWFFSRPAVGTR